MKATGIIRKIDELGRIVIPKEIRRTLHIRETDSMEIFTDDDGATALENTILSLNILKKYSSMGDSIKFAKDYAESMARMSGHSVCITDKEQIIAAAGAEKKELMEQKLSQELEDAIHERKKVCAAKNDKEYVNVTDNSSHSFHAEIISPIISAGDVLGAVIMLSNNEKTQLSGTEQKLTETAADFIGRHMEE